MTTDAREAPADASAVRSGMPKVSVIIPVHNLAHLLAGAVDSVLAQSFPDWELVVVDDASTDATGAVAAPFTSDPRIRYFRLDSNSGPSAARNVGLANTSGELVAFLDADDRWLPSKLEKQVEVFREPSVAVCGVASYLLHPEDRTEVWRKANPFSGDDLYRELLFENSLPGSASSLMVRRACFDEVGLWDEALWAAEDRDLWLRLALRYRFAFLDEPLVRIDRSREDRATRNWPRLAAARERFLHKREHDVPPRFRKLIAKLRQDCYLYIAKCYFRVGEVGKGRAYAWKAFAVRRRPDQGFRTAFLLLMKSIIRPADRVLGTPPISGGRRRHVLDLIRKGS